MGSQITNVSRVRQSGYTFIVIFLGALLGFLDKFTDEYPISIMDVNIGAITAGLGLWVFIATLIAVRSHSPKMAAWNPFLFFLAMLSTYYCCSIILGFFPLPYVLLWGSITLLAPLGGYFVWHSRKEGWFATVCASIPVGFLLAEGQSLFHVITNPSHIQFLFEKGLALCFAVILFIVLAKGNLQRFRMIPIIIIVYFMFDKLINIDWLVATIYGFILSLLV